MIIDQENEYGVEALGEASAKVTISLTLDGMHEPVSMWNSNLNRSLTTLCPKWCIQKAFARRRILHVCVPLWPTATELPL